MEKLRKIKLALSYLIDRDYRDYRLVRALKAFDPDYFQKLLEKIDRQELFETFSQSEDPLWAYFQISRQQLSSAHITADSWRQLLDPCPLFDTWFYLASYRDQVGSRHPFSHYLLEGWKTNLRPSPFFDPFFYQETTSWHEGLGNPLLHYLEYGLQKRLDCSPFFSHDWYLDNTPLPEALQKNAVKHYKLYGATAGKSPVPVFDPHYYCSQVDDGVPVPADPLLHYLCVGEAAGIAPNPQFDPSFYRSYLKDEQEEESVLSHYLRKGVFSRCELNPKIASQENKPVVSIVVPVYNTKAAFLRNCIRSVLYQSYPHWQLWLVDDCSSTEGTRDILSNWTARDERINCIFNEQNRGISATTQTGADHCTGDYLGFLDHDDELSPDCLLRVVEEINRSGPDFLYTDEDLIGDDGSRHTVFNKPGFNRALLYSHNYITHFIVVARSLFASAGGFDSRYDGAQDYDLVLRLTDRTSKISHIPHVLYHWRAAAASTSIDHGSKPYAHEAGRIALQSLLETKMPTMRVEDTDLNYHYRVHIDIAEEPEVTVVVLAESSPDRVQKLESETDYSNCTFLTAPRQRLDDGAAYPPEVQSLEPREHAAAVQEVINGITSEFIAILGEESSGIKPEWLTELVAKIHLEENIAIACGRVSFNGDDGPSYAVPDVSNHSVAYFASFLAFASRHASGLHNLQYVNGCGFEICLIRRSDLADLGGIDFEHFPRHLAMVDLCYRAQERGKKIIYTPEAVVNCQNLFFAEGAEDPESLEEKREFQQRHNLQLSAFDKWYNWHHLFSEGFQQEEFLGWLTGNSG